MSNQVTATLKYALLSDKKMNLIADLVRGKKVTEAFQILEYLPKKGARTLHKLLKSATANAVQNKGLALDNLYIEKIEVGRGPKIKRVRFVSRSRISHYEKYRAYVKVVLNTK
ncbi:MAG: 50S ribosomal protein L22 [Candidatus Peribacteria bacterium]|jgi:large subunit ribosomal protein L22|nr:50S ribosomal protein L22 [Candidatus Peribacteria bacterium]